MLHKSGKKLNAPLTFNNKREIIQSNIHNDERRSRAYIIVENSLIIVKNSIQTTLKTGELVRTHRRLVHIKANVQCFVVKKSK